MLGDLEIIYQDQCLVVVNKPSGLLSLPGRGEDKYDSVTSRLKQRVEGCIEQPSVHRLDMDTSGLMALALDAESHRELSKQFQQRVVEKNYVAVLEGEVAGDAGRIELPFRLDVENRPLQIYDEEHGKVGVTDWKKLAEFGGRTRISYTPLTGRTHQLRVHSAHEKGLGCPIVGDTLYGGHPRHGELMLHARELAFRHPVSGEWMRFVNEPEW